MGQYFSDSDDKSQGFDITSKDKPTNNIKCFQDIYNSEEEVRQDIIKAGIESSNLILGVDYTSSNKHQGEKSFAGKSLHDIKDDDLLNPYQRVISIIGKTLSELDEDNL
jgi:E3 ubiquitin-protein ligase RGLG